MTEKHAREYLCWNNAYVRTLRTLGLKGVSSAPTMRLMLLFDGR
jgi:hypothetical protein